ncbi:MAG: hypothetical protein PUF72_10610 [Clostridiales bacterium]|nr:hypothetical protein [Clostridiales bacterium]
MNNIKLWFISMLVIAAAAGSWLVYGLGHEYGAQKYAQLAIDRETAELNEENKDLQKQCDDYTKEISESKKSIEESTEINSELEDYYSKISEYEEKISTLSSELAAVEKEQQAISGYDVDLNGISNEATGAAQEFADKTLQCPADLAAGRYKINGKGFFRVVQNSTNTVTESQNLSSLDSNCYTLNIPADSKVIVEGTLTFTPVN